MAMGREAEGALEALERRRSGKRYGLAHATRRFNLRVYSERLAVHGICDLVLDVADSATGVNTTFPVEVKHTEGGASIHHVVQLAGYAMLLEEQDGLAPGAIERGFLVLLPSGKIVEAELGPDLRGRFERALADIRGMLTTERFPDPTKHRGFCPDCEYVRFCGDVL
jgi:CRISPR-associated exonuclease Cas4